MYGEMNTPPDAIMEEEEILDEQALAEAEQIQQDKIKALTIQAQLDAWLVSSNIGFEIKDDVLARMGQETLLGYDIDENSRATWKETNDHFRKLLEVKPSLKSYPFEGAANTKYPLLATSSVQFSSRAYSNIIQNDQVVKGKIIGKDPENLKMKRAERISKHMNYQLIEQMPDWLQDNRRMLSSLGLDGCGFKKTYRDMANGINISEYIPAKDLCVNYWAKSLERAARVTHIFTLYPNEIEEYIRNKIFLPFEYLTTTGNDKADASDLDAPHTFLEQHRYWDLDGDKYKEPYIVTVHQATQKVVRVVARWDSDGVVMNDKGKVMKIVPIQYFTKYPFLEAFDGNIYCMGFLNLLGHINETINSLSNEIIDAGHCQNAGGGVISGAVSLKAGGSDGVIKLKLGEYKTVNFEGDDLRKAIVPITHPGPSNATYQALSLFIEAGKNLSTVTDVLTGQGGQKTGIPATTTIAMIEQASQLFGRIYAGVYDALKKELKKLYRLNRLFTTQEEYETVLDDENAVSISDYQSGDCDIIPVGDPKSATQAERLLKSQELMAFIGIGMNDMAIIQRHLEAMNTEDIEELMTPPEGEPEDDPQTKIETMKAQLEMRKIMLDEAKFKLDVSIQTANIVKTLAYAEKLKADAIKALADAEAAEQGQQIDKYKLMVESLTDSIDFMRKQIEEKADADGQGSGRTVESKPSKPSVSAKPRKKSSGTGK